MTTQHEITLNVVATLIHALLEAAEHIKDMDGGDPAHETGWRSEENLDAFVKISEAIKTARQHVEENRGSL